MTILVDFYLAFAVLLITAAGGLVLWHLMLEPVHTSRLKIAAALLLISASIAVYSLAHYGSHLMDHGECPHSEPLAPCPTTPSSYIPGSYNAPVQNAHPTRQRHPPGQHNEAQSRAA
jgi:hypothetical protein